MAFRIIAAAEWGLTPDEANRRGVPLASAGPKRYWFYHHQASMTPDLSPATWDDDPIQWARNLDAYARSNPTQGWSAVPYNHGVHRAPDGTVSLVELRGWGYRSGATLGMNDDSWTLVFAGNFDSKSGPQPVRRLTHDEKIAARLALGHGIEHAHLVARPTVLPHRDNPKAPGATSCCGDMAIADMAELSAWILPSSLLGTPPAPPPPPPPPPVDPPPADVWIHIVQPRETWYGIARLYGVSPGRLCHVNGVALATAPTIYAGDCMAIPGRSVKVLPNDGWIAVTERAGLPASRWKEVATLNGLVALRPGMIVRVPAA